jgi:hypothetical protein
MLTTRVDIVPQLQNLEIAQTTYIDYEFPRHLHQTYVIEVVIQGTVEFDCAGKRHIAPPGSIILIHPKMCIPDVRYVTRRLPIGVFVRVLSGCSGF